MQVCLIVPSPQLVILLLQRLKSTCDLCFCTKASFCACERFFLLGSAATLKLAGACKLENESHRSNARRK